MIRYGNDINTANANDTTWYNILNNIWFDVIWYDWIWLNMILWNYMIMYDNY